MKGAEIFGNIDWAQKSSEPGKQRGNLDGIQWGDCFFIFHPFHDH